MNDPFSVFGVPRRLAFDATLGESLWHERARALHPDHVACATPVAIADATATAAALNAAWKVLRDPLQRARAWLALEATMPLNDRSSAPPDLALRGFRIQEAVESMGATSDGETSELDRLADEVTADLVQAKLDFAALAAREPSVDAKGRAEFRAQVSEWVGRFAYLSRQQLQIDEARGDA